jgi:hypothetical protein
MAIFHISPILSRRKYKGMRLFSAFPLANGDWNFLVAIERPDWVLSAYPKTPAKAANQFCDMHLGEQRQENLD